MKPTYVPFKTYRTCYWQAVDEQGRHARRVEVRVFGSESEAKAYVEARHVPSDSKAHYLGSAFQTDPGEGNIIGPFWVLDKYGWGVRT